MEGSVLRPLKLVCLLAVLAAGAATATAATASRVGGTTVHGGVAKVSGGGPAAKRKRLRVGHSVLLAPRTRTRGCTLAALPDRSCSPGAYSSRLTKAVICSSRFRHRKLPTVSRFDKQAVEQEYGLPAGSYSRALEIDHIIPLRLGGSNDVANMFPEEYAFADHSPGYVVKNRLDRRLGARLCAGRIGLGAAQRQIAANWERLFRKMFGHAAGHPKG